MQHGFQVVPLLPHKPSHSVEPVLQDRSGGGQRNSEAWEVKHVAAHGKGSLL